MPHEFSTVTQIDTAATKLGAGSGIAFSNPRTVNLSTSEYTTIINANGDDGALYAFDWVNNKREDTVARHDIEWYHSGQNLDGRDRVWI